MREVVREERALKACSSSPRLCSPLLLLAPSPSPAFSLFPHKPVLFPSQKREPRWGCVSLLGIVVTQRARGRGKRRERRWLQPSLSRSTRAAAALIPDPCAARSPWRRAIEHRPIQCQRLPDVFSARAQTTTRSSLAVADVFPPPPRRRPPPPLSPPHPQPHSPSSPATTFSTSCVC